MADELFYDIRLQEKSLRDGKLTQKEPDKSIKTLKDVSDNVMEFDDEGNPTNLPERVLKELPIKPAEPEPKISIIPTPLDPLADVWDEMPAR